MDLIGKSWRSLYKSEQIEFIETTVFPELRQSKYWHGEVFATHQDGHQFEEEISLSLTRDNDLICVCQDITNRKQHERQRIIVESLTQSNRELEQFAYAASHDLREPLRKIQSFGQLLQENYCEQLDDNGHRYLGFMVSGANRMEILLQGLLDYSRAGKNNVFSKVDLNTVLKDVKADLNLIIRDSDAQIKYPSLPVIQSNETMMRQLFQNLLSNAIKFHGEAPPSIQIQVKKQTEHFLFSVKDNGIGIPQEFSERIFDIFQRLHGRDEYPGTGIGLSLCRKIIENQGGKIWVQSSVGKGSTFFFTVPYFNSKS